MNKTKVVLMTLMCCLWTFNVYSQEAKIKRAIELIEKKEYPDAKELLNKVLEKNPNDPLAIYFTELIGFKLGSVDKGLIERLNNVEEQYSRFSSVEKINDSLKFNVSITAIAQLKQEIIDKAFAQYYIKSNNIDSLKEFSIYYQPTVLQTAHLKERICLLTFERLDLNNRRDLVSFIKTNADCDQAKVVTQSLVRLDWRFAKEMNSIEEYNQFKIKHTNSELLDSANYFIHEINWSNAVKNDNVLAYKDFISNNPQSPHIEHAKSLYDKQLWESIKTSTDSTEITRYISTCMTCNYKDDAQNLIADMHWARISNTSDTNSLNYFINKWPASNKVQLAYNLKLNLIKFKDRINEIPATVLKNDLTWDDRLVIYHNSTGQYVRTKVYTDGKQGIKERTVENINILIDVDEIVTGDKNIIYSLNYRSTTKNSKLVSNHDGLVGLEIDDFYLSQRLSESFFAISSGNEIYDSKRKEFIPIEMPNYNFSFNRPNVFPYLRIAHPEYLYSETFKSRGNFNYKPSSFNSDLLYSINQDRFFCLNNSGLDYNVTFGSGQKLCLINDHIYKIENLQEVASASDLQTDIVTFNDSMFVSHNHKDDFLTINRLNGLLVNKIDLRELPGFVKSWGKAELNFIEIDQFGQYLYIEWQPVAFDHDKIMTTPYNNSLLAIFDCKVSRFVYIGPHIGVDYTTEKIGWVMTKAFDSYKKENVKIGKARQEPLSKHGLSWNLTNYLPPVNVDKYSLVEDKSLHSIDRSLINLNSIISDDFTVQLNNMIEKLAPVEDIFNQNLVAERKQYLKDSLIAKTHLWIQPNSRAYELHIGSTEVEANIDKNILSHCAKYYIEPDADGPSEWYLEFLPKLINLKREGDLFTFSFRVDSLPTELVESKVRVSDKDMSSIYSGSRNRGNVIQKAIPYSFQGENHITYSFDIVTDDEEFARLINDKSKSNDIAVQFYADWNPSFLLESFEVRLIESHPSIFTLNEKNYWFDLIKDCKNQGVSPWQVSLQLQFISDEEGDWRLPVLLKSEDLKINPLY